MRIAIWGDSITYGECDSKGLGWVGRVRNSLSLDNPTRIYNRGVCGDTSRDLLNRFKTEAESIKPDKIVFAIGINDSKYLKGQTENNVPLEEFKNNIRLLIEQSKHYTKDIFLVSATRVKGELVTQNANRFNEATQRYNKILHDLSQTEGVEYIDVYELLDPTIDLYDGLHPHAEGYEKMSKLIASRIL